MITAGREIFGGIPRYQHYLFAAFAGISIVIFTFGLLARMWRWTGGEFAWHVEFDELPRRLHRLARDVFAQPRLRKHPSAGLTHFFIFWGFLILFAGTEIVAVQHDTPLSFYYGLFYLIFKLVMNLFGLLMLVGIGLAVYRRYVLRPHRLAGGHYAVPLTFLAVLGVTGFLLEGLRMALSGYSYWYDWSPGGAVVAALLRSSGATHTELYDAHLATWWFHAVVTFGFIASLPSTRLIHAITAPLNIFFAPLRPKGALTTPFRLEDLEAGTAEHVAPQIAADLNWQQLLASDACTECGLCEQACPAYAAKRPLSPKQLILSVRNGAGNSGPLGWQTQLDQIISPESAWSCTTCRACVDACPVAIQHIDLVMDVRRKEVLDSRLNGNMVATLENLRRTGNPLGMSSEQRLAWTSGLPVTVKVERTQQGTGFDVLFWVGCSGAYDERGQRVARSVANVLARAGVKFAVLGPEERCSGDPARRLGEEGLFQEFARENIRNLGRYGVKKIITQCPHCFNTLKNEYPEFGGNYQVMHHSEFISSLIAEGRLPLDGAKAEQLVTYHDSCYLGRHNGVYEAPRKALASVPGLKILEMPRKEANSFCCGAGGSNIWYDVGVGTKINAIRYEEALGTGANVIATACPFCMTMFDDAQSSAPAGNARLAIRDVSEIVSDAMEGL